MNPRPVPVMVLGIIGIVWAGLALLFTLGGLVIFILDPAFGPPNEKLEALKHDAAYQAVVLGGSLAGVLLNGLLLAGSIGLLKLRRWSRTLLHGYAALAVVMIVASTTVNALYVMPRTMEATMWGVQRSGPGGAPPAFVESTVRAGMWVGLVVGVLFGLVMPVLVVVMLNLRSVKEAFGGAGLAGAEGANPYRPMV